MSEIERGILKGSGYRAWMERREKDFFDEIDPVDVQVVNGEYVVWARRVGITEKDGYFDFYHIGCDCLGDVPKGQTEVETMLGCNALQQVLLEKANSAAKDIFKVDQVLPYFTVEDEDELFLDDTGQEVAARFIYRALAKTVAEPDNCYGNIRTGVHVRPILRHMLNGVADTQLESILDGLHYQGVIEHNDPLVTLAA